ncbi:MAG: glycosyltransferase family 4 protein, partial [Anaerolineae bacterium]
DVTPMKIGFLSTRIAGADGVSLEIAKLATICRRLGHQVCYCAGELEPWLEPDGMLVPAMHFAHPEARWIHDHSFGAAAVTQSAGPAPLRERIAAMAADLKAAIGRFVADFGVDLLFVQNALAIPMHIPLGVALTDYIAETGIPTLAHNHDLPWERERFAVNCIPDILERCFPPNLPSVRHLAINSLAQRELARRKGIAATLFPNIFDFATAAPGICDFNADLRQALGLREDQLFILQPTRVIARKGIELAIELVRRLREKPNRIRLADREAVLVITHPAGDEGLDYLARIQAQAQAVGVPLLYVADRFAADRGWRDGQKIYSLWDAYVHADFVTYPSFVEGFGNALLEAIYFRLPILVNRYPVYAADIGPAGFDLIEVDAAISDAAVEQTIAVLTDGTRRRRMVERNYELARSRYSYEAVTPLLASLLEEATPR